MEGDLHILLVKVFRSHYKKSHTYLGKQGITPGQPRILGYLFENDGCIQREIAEKCNLEPATVTSILDNMQKSGLIERHASKNDRRIQNIYITEKGKEKRETIRKIFGELDRQCFAGFSDDELEQLVGFLNRMLKNMNNEQQ